MTSVKTKTGIEQRGKVERLVFEGFVKVLDRIWHEAKFFGHVSRL